MDLDHRVPFLDRHVVEHAIAKDASVVHHDVDAAEIVDCVLHHALRVFPARDAAGVGHGATLAVRLLDFLDHALSRARILALAGDRRADVVHHDLGAVRGQGNRRRPSDPAAGAGYDRDLPVKHTHRFPPSKWTGPPCDSARSLSSSGPYQRMWKSG